MTELQTKTQAVTVYPDRARITRRGELALEPGIQTVEVPGLPLAMQTDSLRVSARGTSRARLLGAQVRRVFFEEAPDERIRDLEQQIEGLTDEIASLDARSEAIGKEAAALDSLGAQTETYATALAAGEMQVEDQLALFERLRSRKSELDETRREITRQKRELKRRLDKLQNEINRWKNIPRRETNVAIVELDVSEQGDLAIELIYVVPGAGWQPVYDFRLVELERKAEIEVGYLAEVRQHTGEDWQEVKLTLSTARPALASILPELRPWYIGPMPPPRPAMKMAAQAARPAAYAIEEHAEARPAGAEIPEVMAVVDSSGASATYRIPSPATIPADSAAHKVIIARFRLEPQIDYTAAPKLVEAVYRRATVLNQSPYTLLPGKANIFANEEFVGSSRLDLIAPQGEIELFLGVDDRIRIQRELQRRDVDKTLIGGRRRRHYGYEIEVENLRPVEVRVEIHDQIPVAQHEDIKVELKNVQPQPTERSELNLLEWELALAPEEKKTVRFDFTVEAPRDMELIGLV